MMEMTTKMLMTLGMILVMVFSNHNITSGVGVILGMGLAPPTPGLGLRALMCQSDLVVKIISLETITRLFGSRYRHIALMVV